MLGMVPFLERSPPWTQEAWDILEAWLSVEKLFEGGGPLKKEKRKKTKTAGMWEGNNFKLTRGAALDT